ncbi:MAG: polysaccharide export protein [Christensenellaceae bacterium]|nr:polysaccharide export protein [Christensenellaceae bacterium]
MERENSVEINLVDLFFYVKKRVWILILAAIVSVVATYAVCNFLITPEYLATTTVWVLKKDNNGSNSDLAYSDIQMATQLAKDYQVLIRTRNVTSKVIEILGLNMTSSQLAGKITVTSPNSGDTRILNINVRDEDPQLAARMANCVREVAISEIQRIMNSESLIALEDALDPDTPTSPATEKNTIIAGLLGGVAAFAVLFICFVMDDRIKNEEDVERYLHLNTVGTIPYCFELETVKAGDKKSGKKAPPKKKAKKEAGETANG